MRYGNASRIKSRRWLMPSVMASLVGAAALLAQMAVAPVQAAPATEPAQIAVDVGSQRLLRESQAVHRIALADPNVADVNVVSRNEVLIVGKAAGTTSLMVWPSGSASPWVYNLSVKGGVAGTMADLVSHRGAVLAATDQVRAAAGPNASKDVVVTDQSQVLVDTQVLSEVKIVELERTTAQQFGINLLHANRGAVMGVTSASSVNGVGYCCTNEPFYTSATHNSTGTGPSVGSSTGFQPLLDAFSFLYADHSYLAALDVLESQGLARTLAEPSLTAMSGQTASFLAGGEFPFPTVQNGGSGSTSITVVFKEFGIRLNLTPTVLANDRIAIKVAPEVSELNFQDGITVAGVTIPGLNVRRTDTMVELGDGETFVLSGLVSNNLVDNVDKVPWLGDLPVIGALFRQTSYSRDEKELVMTVTPHIVHPIAKGAPLPALPGASTYNYRPSFAQTMFMETGSFGQNDDHGFSR